MVRVPFLRAKGFALTAGPMRRQIRACRIAQPLDLAVNLPQELRCFCTVFLNALLVRPESPTFQFLEPVPVPHFFPVVFVVAEDRQAIFRLSTVPPDLACAIPGLVRLICSQTIFVPAATSTDSLGLRGDGALIVLIRPAGNAQVRVLRAAIAFRARLLTIPPTASARAIRHRKICSAALWPFDIIAHRARLALAVFVALLPSSELLPAKFNEVRIFAEGRVAGAIIPDVRAIQISLASVFWIVRLHTHTLWRAACDAQATTGSVQAVHVVRAFHSNLFAMLTDPRGPCRPRLFLPPRLQALVLRVVSDRHGRTIPAIAWRMASHIRWTIGLPAVFLASLGVRLHAEGQLVIHGSFPAACGTRLDASHVEGAVHFAVFGLADLWLVVRVWDKQVVYIHPILIR